MNYVGKFDATLSAAGPGPNFHGHFETITQHATHAPAGAIIVPDSQLLFNGDFKRSGVDLVLSHDHHELVLHDYFRGEKRATLSSPDGAHLTGDLVNALTGHTEYAQAGGATAAAQVIGHVTKLTGTATAVRNGVSIILNNGDNVEKGDVVQSGSDSTLGITFIDGTVFGLSSNARMVLNEMVYDPNGSNNSSLISLVAGTISFVAGETAKHGDMKVDTPVATMGIRGTAVLVEIDFNVPGQGGAPDAKFQVLVEPDGTTGSYILFDKNTLTPIATVNQAGQQINISQGQVSITNAPLPPDIQKLITDVFSLKFTDNSNPKTFDHFTDSVVPQSLTPILLPNGTSATPIIINPHFADDTTQSNPNAPGNSSNHIPGPPAAVILGADGQPTTSFFATELAGRTHDAVDIDSVSVRVNWVDVNVGDTPSALVKFGGFTYQNAAHTNVTATLSAQQLADIAAIELNLVPVPGASNKNTGSATITYSLPDNAFDFLAAGESVTLSYLVEVHNNFTANDEVTPLSFTITITGTNDVPTIAATSAALAEHSSATDHAGGTITFTDADLTDRPAVSTTFSAFSYRDTHGNDITSALTAEQQAGIAAVEASLTLVPSLTNTNNGSVTWSYDIADGKLGFLADGDTLTLTYLASVDDGHGGLVTTPITVTILGVSDVPYPISELSGHTGDTTDFDTVSGKLTFVGVDQANIQNIANNVVAVTWSGGSVLPGGLTSTLQASLTETTTNGVGFKFSAADNTFDFLADGETLAVIYDVTVTDSHGFNATRPVTIIVTGTNDTPMVTGETQIGAITERSNESQPNPTGSTALDTATGTVTFTDVDLSDHHTVTVTGVMASGTTSGLPNDTTVLSWLSLGVLTDTTGTGTGGSDAWTFSAQDKSFDYLAAGETLTLTYAVQVADGHGGVVSQPVTITVAGTNDTPTISATNGAIAELSGTGNAAIDHAGGTISFTDVDLSDRPVVSEHFTSFTFQDASHNDVTSLLTAGQEAAIAAVEAMLTLTPSASNTNNGSVAWSYAIADSKLDFLAAGDTLSLTYTATVDDGHGGSVDQPFTLAVTGTNDVPTIQGVTAPAIQTVIAVNSAGPIILAQGVDTNSFGLATEIFDSRSSGTSSNNGAGHGNFFSETLNATFSGTGHAGIVNGSFGGVTAAPFIGPLPGSADTTNYLSIGAGGTETIKFTTLENAFGLYWGSVDPFNTIEFYNGTHLVASYSGADVNPLFASGNQGSFSANGYVEFSGLGPFDKVVFETGNLNAFEIDNVSAGSIHAQLAAPIAGTLSVSDADIGDTLTASVTGNAVIEYNGSSALPANADISSLIATSAIKFDSVTSNGGTEVLDWSYAPTNPNLDFLKAGDTLTITFNAQVDDGHATVGNQPLTISIVGADKSASMSAFSVVSGTTQNDTFNNVGQGVTIFGGGGDDNFMFNAAFKSATIGDFDVNKDTISVSHTLFASVSAILAGAQPANSGHDTVITDTAHDTITLKGVSVAQIQAHPTDFHLV